MDLRKRVLSGLECCINEQRTVPECERCPYAENGDTCVSLHKLHADAMELIKGSEPVINGVWEYYTNDEGKARWRCSKCGKVCRRNPHDKARCSRCGAVMRFGGVGMLEQDMREKVIEGLEFTLVESSWDANRAFDEQLMIEAVTDAITLLKAQEPVPPVKVNRYIDTDENGDWYIPETYDCGNCGVELHGKANYCHLCGRKVKWE